MKKDYTQATCILSLAFVYAIYVFLVIMVMVNYGNEPVSKKDIVLRSRARARGRRCRTSRRGDLEYLSLH